MLPRPLPVLNIVDVILVAYMAKVDSRVQCIIYDLVNFGLNFIGVDTLNIPKHWLYMLHFLLIMAGVGEGWGGGVVCINIVFTAVINYMLQWYLSSISGPTSTHMYSLSITSSKFTLIANR